MRLEIPGYEYFAAKNLFSGNKGMFNFKIFPSDTDMTVKIWFGAFCLERSQVEREEHFAMDQNGYAAMCEWLERAEREARQED